MEHDLLQVHRKCLASGHPWSLLDGNTPYPPTPFIRARERRVRTAAAPAPFLVCVGNGEPGGGHRAGLAPPPSLLGAPVPSVHGPGGG